MKTTHRNCWLVLSIFLIQPASSAVCQCFVVLGCYRRHAQQQQRLAAHRQSAQEPWGPPSLECSQCLPSTTMFGANCCLVGWLGGAIPFSISAACFSVCRSMFVGVSCWGASWLAHFAFPTPSHRFQLLVAYLPLLAIENKISENITYIKFTKTNSHTQSV